MVATNIARHMSAFEPFFRTLEDTTFPLFNIFSEGNKITLELAVAGFTKDEISIEVNPNSLTVRGEKRKEVQQEGRRTLAKGISYRNFVRTFTIAKDAEVTEASLENGILSITIEVPVKAPEVRRVVIK